MLRMNRARVLPVAGTLSIIGLTAAGLTLAGTRQTRQHNHGTAPAAASARAPKDACCAGGQTAHQAGEACPMGHEGSQHAEGCAMHAQSARTAAQPGALPMVRKAGALKVTLESPHRQVLAGKNPFSVRVADAAGKPVKDARVTVAFTMPEMDHGKAVVPARPERDGSYSLVGNLAMPGLWRAKVSVNRPKQRPVDLTFDLTAGEPPAAADAKAGSPPACPYAGDMATMGHDH